MRTALALAAAAVLALAPAARAESTPQAFDAAVTQILAQPYQPDYVPLGTDGAFAPALVATSRRRRTTPPARSRAAPTRPRGPRGLSPSRSRPATARPCSGS